jgi:pilus assembly protein CpaB
LIRALACHKSKHFATSVRAKFQFQISLTYPPSSNHSPRYARLFNGLFERNLEFPNNLASIKKNRALRGRLVNKKIVPMVGLAVVFGGISIFVADGLLKSKSDALPVQTASMAAPQQPTIETKKIVVAREALRYGAELTPDLLIEIDWPANSLPEGAFQSISDITASGRRVVLSPVEPNEPVLVAKLSGADGRATLSNRLAPGMRAVTIRVDDISGVAGFVAPGDRVDVLLTRQQVAVAPTSGEGQAASAQPGEFASEVILEDIKVLTADQNADERSTTPGVVRAVTVEVSSEQAQKVALAQQSGTLYLLLRAAGDQAVTTQADVDTIKTTSTTAGSGLLNGGPKFRTLIVTRGHVAENYTVVEEKKRNGDAQ